MRNKLGFAVVAVLMVGGLGWALWGMDLTKAASAVASFRVAWMIPIVALHSSTFVLRTQRFRLLLDHPVGFRSTATVTAVGFLAINVVPLRMGEFVRPYLLAEQHGVPFGSGLAAVLLERLLDMMALLTLLFLCAWFVHVPGTVRVGDVDLLAAGQGIIGASALIGIVGVIALAIGGPTVVEFGEAVLRRVFPPIAEPFSRIATRFVGGFRALASRPARAVSAVVCTAGVWGGTTLSILVGMWGFPAMNARVDAALLNWASTMTAMVVAPTPGFVGSFEAGSVGSLTLFDVPDDLARAFAVVMHLSMLAFTVILGLAALAFEGWSLTHVVRESRNRSA